MAEIHNFCMFSGEVTDSREHIFPRWLQRRFALYEQSLSLPNGTSLKYKHATIPAATEHNNAFGVIENNISRGVFKPMELYLWAYKVHLGMLYKHTTFKLDRSLASSPTIFNPSAYENDLWIFRKLYDVWRKGGQFNPSPLGSVFLVDSPFGKMDFTMIHCLRSGTVAVNLGEKYLVVFLTDQGEAIRSNALKLWHKFHADSHKRGTTSDERRELAYMSAHVWTCETAQLVYQNRRSWSVLATHNSFNLMQPLISPEQQLPTNNREEYEVFCNGFGLTLQHFGDRKGHIYQPFDRANPNRQ